MEVSPSGEEPEVESPRGGDMVPCRSDEDHLVWRLPLWLIFEKNVILKSHSKTSGGKKGFMSAFSELWGAKGCQSRCFAVTFATFFGDFLDYG